MSYLDAILGLLVIGFAIQGWRAGLIHESLTLLGFFVGLLAGGRYNEAASVLFIPWLHTRNAASLAAFLAILFGTWAIVLILGALLREMLQGMRLGWIDGLGGILFGAAKGLFMAEVIVLVMMALPGDSARNTVTGSFIGRRLASVAPDLLALVPPVLRYWKPF